MQFTYQKLLALEAKPDDIDAKRYREYFADGTGETAPGLAIRVAPTGRRTFTFHYTFNGKRARMDLGQFPAFTLADARNAAKSARAALEAVPPRDPRKVRDDEQAAAKAAADNRETVTQVIEKYLADPDIAKLRTVDQTARILRNEFGKFIGDKIAADVTRRDLAECLDRVRQRGAATYAARCHTHLRLCFDWAVKVVAILESNPMESLAKPVEPEVTGDKVRAMDDDELAAFWNGIRDALPTLGRDVYARILKLTLLTGCRISEIAEIQPGEIRDGVLTIPGERTKNAKPHAIPLNAAMLELLGNDLDNPWGLVADTPVTGPRLTVLFSGRDISKRLGSVKGYTIHGLRRTCATYLDEMGFPESTISLCLNHSPKREKRPDAGATVTRRYIKAKQSTAERRAAALMELKRQAFNEWTACVLATAAAD
ncbi:integrase [Bradyrhizobium sp. AZCC 1578]|uniref:tyrosine-type recombinase/integrase n=1 Tax=Bradyrhizobium sp. AZCC 1578 TaxID=3117027 RepID=UPI002FF3E3A4